MKDNTLVGLILKLHVYYVADSKQRTQYCKYVS